MRDARYALAYVLALVTLAAGVGSARGAKLEWGRCPQSAVVVSAARMDCGWLTRRVTLAGEPVRLRVVILRARPGHHDAAPVVYVPGGPGAGAGLDDLSLRTWRQWQQRAGWQHDIVLFDPRGTGQSLPRVGCDVNRGRRTVAAATNVDSRHELGNEARIARQCYRRLGYQTAANLGPQTQLQDLAALVQALAVTRVNLWAVSYGTRIARLFVHRHPERVRALVLDSLFPFEHDDLLAMPAQIGGAIARLDAVCNSDAEQCSTAGRSPSAVVHMLLKRYELDPARVTLNTSEADELRFVVTPYRLLLMILLAGYDASHIPDTVSRLTRAFDGEPGALRPLAERLRRRTLTEDHSEAVFWSTRCAFGGTQPNSARWRTALSPYPELEAYLAPARDSSVCDFWRVPKMSLPAPGASVSAQTLVIAGQRDAVTPADWGRAFAGAHRNARLLTLAGVGHAGSFSSPCALRAIEQFWQAPRTLGALVCD